MKNFLVSSLKTKLILSSALIVSALLGLFAVYEYELEQKKVTSELEVLSGIVVNRLSENLALPLWELDTDWINKTIDTEILDKQVYAIFVSGDDGLLVGKKRNLNGRPIPSINNVSREEYIVKSKKVLRENEQIGTVKVYITRKYMKIRLREEASDRIYLTLIVISLLVVFLMVMLDRIIINPIASLLRVTKDISRGVYDRPVNVSMGDEIGELGTGFDLMQKNILQREKERDKAVYALKRNSVILEKTNDELNAYQDHLESLVEKRTEELRQARDNALEATQAKSEFLASMSHELRTPLNSIIGFTGIVKDGGAGDINEEQSKQLTLVYTSAKHLLSLINDILDLSKIEAGKHEVIKEMVSLLTLFNELGEMVQPLADEKKLSLRIDTDNIPEQLYTDRSKLKQILLNLLANAIKFTKVGTISLRCEVAGEDINISVIDTGIGIDPAGQEKIFQAFSQADSGDTRLQEGTGLGLAISRQFAELLGGSLDVESELGTGSRFTVCLPMETSTAMKGIAGGVQRTIPRVPYSSNPLVLVIDDHADAQELLTRYLKHEGYEVMLCDNGQDAVELARKHQPFAITLDIMMPRLNGWDTLSLLKGDKSTSAIPVIIISILDEANMGLSLGAVDYLQKPIESEQLLKSLRNLCLPHNDIMIVEDRVQDADMLKKMLEPMDCNIRHALDGFSALEEISQQCPDLLLLDLMMPEMSGFEVIRRLRLGEYPECDIKIIVISSKTLTEAEAEYLHNNVVQVMEKGKFSHNEMLSEVSKLLGSLDGSNHPK